jgi:hypothetical protein
VRSSASYAKPTAVPSRPTTSWTAIAMTAMVSLSRQKQVSPLSSESKKPYKKSGGNKGMAFIQSMFEACVKSQKKAGKSKKCKKDDYDFSDSSDSE